jgi:mannose-6-phosphate isomerase
MIGDHPNGTTKVLNGELAGLGLDEVRERYGKTIFGTKAAAAEGSRFPLLIKLLDCNDDLSIQVHPDNDYKELPAGELGKTEMWYVLDAKPGAKIIYGLKPGMTREAFAESIRDNRIMDSLQEVEVQAGDSFYIPAGTVHALCAGVLVAEIQQNSDTTYRLYDYDRLGLDGKPRELHVEHSLNVTAYGDSGATRMKTDIEAANCWLRLAASRYFIVEKGVSEGVWKLATSPESFTILVICGGTGTLDWADGSLPAKRGDCFLLPADLGEYSLNGGLTVLRSYLP